MDKKMIKYNKRVSINRSKLHRYDQISVWQCRWSLSQMLSQGNDSCLGSLQKIRIAQYKTYFQENQKSVTKVEEISHIDCFLNLY